MGYNSTVLTNPNGLKFNLSISWSENSTSTENNTSNVTVTAKLYKNNARFDVANAGTLRAYWHDNKGNTDYEVASLAVTELGYNSTERVASATFNVTHKDDGTLSGYAYASWERTNSYGGHVPTSGSTSTGWENLTTIARQVNIKSVTGSFTDENLSPIIAWTNNGNRVDIEIELPDLGVNPWKRWNNKQGSSSFTPTFSQADINDLRSRLANAKSTTLRFTVVTVINGTDSFWSYQDKTFTIVNGEPTFSNFTYEDTNSATTAITGNSSVMISGRSTIAATISAANKATARKSATMSKYTFQVAGLSAEQAYATTDITKTLGSPTVSPTELPSATRDLVVTAVDSRGNSTAVTKSVIIVPYEAPKVAASAQRVNGFENATTIKISGSYSRIEVSGTAKNTVNTSSGVQYRYRQQGTSTWGSWTNRSCTIDTATGKITVADFQMSLSNQNAYEFEAKITDRLETTTVSFTVSVGQPAFYIGTDGRVSVGGMPSISKPSGNSGQLEIHGNGYSNGSLLMTLDRVYPVGSIFISATHSTAQAVANALGGGTWQAFGAGRVPVGVDTSQTEFNTPSKTGGSKTVTLTVNQIPSHHHTYANTSGSRIYDVRYGVNGWGNTGSLGAGFNGGTFDASVYGGDTGGGQAHNNLQPYITVYMWKRTA